MSVFPPSFPNSSDSINHHCLVEKEDTTFIEIPAASFDVLHIRTECAHNALIEFLESRKKEEAYIEKVAGLLSQNKALKLELEEKSHEMNLKIQEAARLEEPFSSTTQAHVDMPREIPPKPKGKEKIKGATASNGTLRSSFELVHDVIHGSKNMKMNRFYSLFYSFLKSEVEARNFRKIINGRRIRCMVPALHNQGGEN